MNAWTLAGLGLNFAVLIMLASWFLAKRINNAGVGDVGWAYGFTIIVAIFSLSGPGDPTRRLVLGLMVALWSLRLGTHLLFRLRRQGEDSRYKELREQFPKRPWHMFFGFYFLQAIFLAVFCIPFGIIASDPSPAFSRLDLAALVLWAVGFLGEVLADWQLARARPAGRVCQTGLWRFSRHPNHFCECLMWMGYFGLALSAPGGWITLFAPLLMLFLLTRVTGLPPSEEGALRVHGEAYRDYQRRTSPFLPGWPR